MIQKKIREQKKNIFKGALVAGSCLAALLICMSVNSKTETYNKGEVKTTKNNVRLIEYKSENRVDRKLKEIESVATSILEVGVGAVLNNTLEETLVAKESSLNTVTASSELIKETKSAEDLIPAGNILYASTNLNARLEPSEKSERICGINTGDKLVVIEDIGNGWVKVNYKDKEVYVYEDYLLSEPPMKLVSSTAYYDEYNRTSASGRELIEGYSIAGRVSWLHKKANVYSCNSDGTVGQFLGTYSFDDTGYGQESGVGESKILKGRTIGTIENGTCVDFFFNTREACIEYGRRNVYIQIIE